MVFESAPGSTHSLLTVEANGEFYGTETMQNVAQRRNYPGGCPGAVGWWRPPGLIAGLVGG